MLEIFRLLRQASTALLSQLSQESWARTGLHAERGELSLAALFEICNEHSSAHARQIESMRSQLLL